MKTESVFICEWDELIHIHIYRTIVRSSSHSACDARMAVISAGRAGRVIKKCGIIWGWVAGV